VLVRSPDRDGINDCGLEGTNEHVRSRECCERRRLAAGGRHRLAGGRRLRRRGSILHQMFDKTLDAPVSTVLSEFPTVQRDDAPVSNDCEHEGFGPAAENSVGPRPASRVLLSSVLFQIA
jgi:hypothetical protein